MFGALAYSSSVVLNPNEDTDWGYSVAAICVYVFVLLPYLGIVYFILYHICSEDGLYCSFENFTYSSTGVSVGSIADSGSDAGAGAGTGSDAGAGTGTGAGSDASAGITLQLKSDAGAPSESAPTDVVMNESSLVTTAKSDALHWPDETTVFHLNTVSTGDDAPSEITLREPKEHECIVCKMHTDSRCKACEKFWYCSQACQEKVTIQLS